MADPKSKDSGEAKAAPKDDAPADASAGKSEGGKGDAGGGGSEGDTSHEDKPKKPSPLKNPLVLVGLAVVVVILLVAALLYWLHVRQYQSTDDAYVETHIVNLAPQVSGQVVRVLVDDNAEVRAGQLLVEIDPAAARHAVDQALGQRADALARMAQAKAQLAASQATYRQTLEQARSYAAQADLADRDARRYRGLLAVAPRAVAQQQVDQAVSQAKSSAAQRDAALQQAQGAADQIKAAQTAIESAQASLKSADATVAQNQLTAGHNQVIAPVDGYVAQKSVAAGGYVQPGQQLMAIVPQLMWVTANFKETQLKLMRVGQPAFLSIDACPVQLNGRIDSIQRGAGEAFALLPPENATGNFVKVVQRVPVKITFRDIPKYCPMGPGLSVTVRVKVR
jgi:membrane fusion protein (multidrug efflux system)